MKTLLFIHQSAELYGSDKTLYELVKGLSKRGYNSIVVLPEHGPLTDCLREAGIEVILCPVIKVSRSMFTPTNLILLPFQTLGALRQLEKALTGRPVDLVYSNTLAVLIGLFYARRKKIAHIWHVHEIIRRPSVVRGFFSYLLSLKINRAVIHNSEATKNFWKASKGVGPYLNTVVLNGIAGSNSQVTEQQRQTIRADFFDAGRHETVILLVGRINRWKGQQLLLEALLPLFAEKKAIRLVYIGSPPPGQPDYEIHLKANIVSHGVADRAKVLPFQSDIWPFWQSADIAVVPSTEPEPFGLVALEAMLCAKPVIAANHGGLAEIVVHNDTGLLFEPGNAADLERKLRVLIEDSERRLEMGINGQRRAKEVFSSEHYVDGIEKVCKNLLTSAK